MLKVLLKTIKNLILKKVLNYFENKINYSILAVLEV